MRELRKCANCPRYFWTPVQPLQEDNIAERLKFCRDCWDNRMQKPITLKDIEHENSEMSEQEKQADNSQEENGERYRRYRVN